MAGDWIPMRCDLVDDNAVIGIADRTGIDQDTVVGKLHRLWCWAGRIIKNDSGIVLHVRPAWIDNHVRVKGFAQAMVAVGWLVLLKDGLRFVKWERWNGKSEKIRLGNAERQRAYRARNKNVTAACDNFVTSNAPQERTEEDIRGKNSPKTPSCSEPVKPPDSEPILPLVLETETEDPVLLRFPIHGKSRLRDTDGKPEWHLHQSKINEYKASYPYLDVFTECMKALQWCRDNPAKRKTYRGMPAFLTRWLMRAQDRGRGGQALPFVDTAERREKARRDLEELKRRTSEGALDSDAVRERLRQAGMKGASNGQARSRHPEVASGED